MSTIHAIVGKSDSNYYCSTDDNTIYSESFREIFEKSKNLLPSTGGRIELASGTYSVDSTLEIDVPLSIHGVGVGNTSTVDDMTILKASPDLRGPVVEVTGANAQNKTMHGSGIVDLGIVGHKGGNQTHCLLLNSSDGKYVANMFFERLLLDNANRDGMNIRSAEKHLQLRDLWIGHCNRDALSIEDGYRYWITNGYFYDSRYGVNIKEPVSDVSIIHPHCRKNRRAGMKIESDRFQVAGGRSVNNRYGAELYGDHGIVSGGEYINNEVGIVLGSDRSGPTGSQLFMNRIGVAPRGKHRTNRIKAEQADDEPDELDKFRQIIGNKLDEFIQTTNDEGVGEAINRSARYMLKISKKNILPSEKKRTIGLQISGGATDSNITGNTYLRVDREVIDNGTGTLIENTAEVSGDPREAELWSDRAQEGTTVWDSTNSELYIYIGGEWRHI